MVDEACPATCNERAADVQTTCDAPVLTAEQIAGETMCRCSECGVFWNSEFAENDEECSECGGTIHKEPSHVLMAIGAHAALTAALARCVEARDKMRKEAAQFDQNAKNHRISGSHNDYLRHDAIARGYRWSADILDEALASPEVAALAAKGGTQ